jgi:hypothetical protein
MLIAPNIDRSKRGETDFFSGEPLRALSTLVFSDNIDLQRSASLTFAEITERGAYCTDGRQKAARGRLKRRPLEPAWCMLRHDPSYQSSLI